MERDSILITGGSGYLGSVLCDLLLRDNISKERITVADLARPAHDVRFIKLDMRDSQLGEEIGRGQTVVHLASIVKAGRVDEATAQDMREVNLEATKRIADICKEKKARLILASSCSAYGVRRDGETVDETYPLESTSVYSETKIRAEQYVSAIADDYFKPVVLRLATLFGYSQRMSFEPLLNAMIAEAVRSRRIKVISPMAWRPLVHVKDAARCIASLLDKFKDVSGTFNVGADHLNFRKIDLAQAIVSLLPTAQIETKTVQGDRSYRVSFAKIKTRLGFLPTESLNSGISELIASLNSKSTNNTV